MANLPTLRGCGRQAVLRIELYSPRDGMLQGSLDASAYACPEHVGSMVAAVHAASLTAYRVPDPDLPADRVCGYVFAYPTATGSPEGVAPVNTPDDERDTSGPETGSYSGAGKRQRHPRWCARDRSCGVEGIHRSRPYPATTREAHAAVRVWLEQASMPDAPVSLILEITEEGETRYCWMPTEQGRLLAYQVRRLLDASKAGRR